MKIYNFGNDYVFQQKQKLEQETSTVNPSPNNELKEESYVENQDPDAGAGNEPVVPEKNDKQESAPEIERKKKETRAKGQKKQEDSQV